MASGFFLLLDDIATVLDDVAAMTKVAAKKTAGVLGDDLALNAQQVTGVNADRELPVVWAVAKGSALNKAILVPLALAISAWLPALITPLLMLGGAFLCFEGVEKLLHKWLHRADGAAHQQALRAALADPAVDMLAFERDKVKGAVRTDFILSGEIIVISLGAVAGAPFGTQLAVLVAISVTMTVGVYGLVAGIVKLDDAGLALSRASGAVARGLGQALLAGAPWLMKALSVLGTAAMFLVGGGILTHGVPVLHHLGAGLVTPLALLMDAAVGIAAGAVVVAVVQGVQRLRGAP